MLEDKKAATNVGVGIGIFLQVGAQFLVVYLKTPVPGVLLSLVGTGCIVWGCINYCQGKGQPAGLGLLGLLSILGLLILISLPDHYPDGVRRRRRYDKYEDEDDSPRRARARRDDDEDDDDDYDRPRRSRPGRYRPAPVGVPVWAWVAIAAVCSVGFLFVVAAVLVIAGQKADNARAPGPAPAPAAAARQDKPEQPKRTKPVGQPAPPAERQPPPRVVPVGKGPVILGSISDPLFKTVGPAGGILIGVEARFEPFGPHDIVRAVRPIYRVGGREEFGKQYGTDLTGAVTLKAKDGYAVGGISGKANLWCHGFSLTYMKVRADGTLDPADAYESEWAGWNGDMPVTRVVGGGLPVVGIAGKIVGPKTTALGLLFKGQEGFDPDAGTQANPFPTRLIPVGAEPTIIAGPQSPPFKDLAPGGGVLVGLELALGTFAGADVIKAARPIYRVGEKDAPGAFRGTSRNRLTTIKARPGYAVGALSCKSGLNFDGVSLTFMRVKADGMLDPADAYESEWVGWDGGKPVTKLGGDGTPVVGVVGRASGTELNGFGLLFMGQEGFEPAGEKR